MNQSHANPVSPVGAVVYVFAAFVTAPICTAAADEFDPRAEFLPHVVRATPAILKSQDPLTGRFGPVEGWTVARQNVVFVLAAAWRAQSDHAPDAGDEQVLQAIIAGGDALIAAQDTDGRFPFYGSDGEAYGRTYLPWTCSRWVRAYAVVKDAMPTDAEARWQRALSVTFAGIAAELRISPVQNIPAHHAMALYVAGRALDRPQWRRLAP